MGGNSKSEKRVLLTTAATSVEANMIKSLLEANGIFSFIKEKGISGIFSEALFGAEIYVLESDKEKALKIIQRHQNER